MTNEKVQSASVETYILRLLDECRAEIARSDSKASILFAAVAGTTALLANALLDTSTQLRANGAAVTAMSLISCAMLVLAMVFLGLAVIPRVGNPEPGKARYFEEHAQFGSDKELLSALVAGATESNERHAHQLHVQSRIACRKYQYLRSAVYIVGGALGTLGVALFLIAIR